MPEYRRFIAYFYEYIDGKKEKNAGFAKVELRNGMWRILFRLMPEGTPEDPLQVCGFVREDGYLLGFPLGTLNAGREIGEEWAYQEEVYLGHERWRFADLSGILMKSRDDRIFLTVWDDEAADPAKFVLELPRKKAEENVAAENAAAENTAEGVQEEQRIEPSELLEHAGKQTDETRTVQSKSATEEVVELPKEQQSQAAPEEMIDIPKEQHLESAPDLEAAETEADMEIDKEDDTVCVQKEKNTEPDTIPDYILQQRRGFQPFSDDEIRDCVQMMPCDIVRLQQDAWQVGRSSFLQHGFYQYRHLLLGRKQNGGYVIGVPGIQNQQEQYMAGLFGYDRFKTASSVGAGKAFGYWYRDLVKKE